MKSDNQPRTTLTESLHRPHGAVARVRAPAREKILAVAVAILTFAVVELPAFARERLGVQRGGGRHGVAPRQRVSVVDASDSTARKRGERGSRGDSRHEVASAGKTLKKQKFSRKRRPTDHYTHATDSATNVVLPHLASLCSWSNNSMSAGVDDSGEGWVGGETGATGDGVGSVSGVTGEEGVSGDTGEGVSGVTEGVVGSGLKETTGDGVGEATGELDGGGIVAAGMRVADLDGAGGLDDAGGLVLRPWLPVQHTTKIIRTTENQSRGG